MNNLKANLQKVYSRIDSACRAAGRRAEDVRVLAVSKKHTAERIRALHQLGQTEFGESYLQEALEKQAALADARIKWHFIGPVQSNKTRPIADHFDWVQSVDREKILRRLSEQRDDDRGPLQICLQVNIDREPQKAGCLPESVTELAALADHLPLLRLRGLMAIPRATDDVSAMRDSFAHVRAIYQDLQSQGHELDTLSMGMSADLEQAILEGSTMIRIGTDLLGPRPATTEKEP